MLEGVQHKELCVQQREVNDVAMLLQCKPVCSCKSTYIFFQYFFFMCNPKKKLHIEGSHRKKITCVDPHKKKKMHMEGSSTSPAPACSIWPVMAVVMFFP